MLLAGFLYSVSRGSNAKFGNWGWAWAAHPRDDERRLT